MMRRQACGKRTTSFFKALTRFGQKSDKLREEMEKLRDVLNETLKEVNVVRETTMKANAEKLQLKA